MSAGKDLFSYQSSLYARYRPKYPPALYQELVAAAPAQKLAWDVGTGSGQCAVALASYFNAVVGTDLSAGQIAHAAQHERVRYEVTSACPSLAEFERAVGPAGSIDLITVAQALHWFDHDHFFDLAAKVLKPGGIVAAWTYYIPSISPEVDEVFARFYTATGPYWDAARGYIDNLYRTIPFPLEPLPGRDGTGPFEFETELAMTVDDLIGFISSWSPLAAAKKDGRDLVAEFEEEFRKAWETGPKEKRAIYPIYLRIGRPRR